MSEDDEKPCIKKFQSFFSQAPKISIMRAKTFATRLTQYINPKVMNGSPKQQIQSIHENSEEAKENEDFNFGENSQTQIMKNNSKVSQIGKFASFFKKASIQIEEKTFKNMESFKRCLTAQSKNEINCNSSLAVSQLEDQLIDKNAASFANMTLELSMNTNNFHQMPLPSKDTNQSHRELNFDLTQNAILEKSESQENILIENNVDQILENNNQGKKQQNEENKQMPHLNNVYSLFKKSPNLVKQKSMMVFTRFLERLDQQKKTDNQKLVKQESLGDIGKSQEIKQDERQSQKLKRFFTQGTQQIQKKSTFCWESFKQKITNHQPIKATEEYNQNSKMNEDEITQNNHMQFIQIADGQLEGKSEQIQKNQIVNWLQNQEEELLIKKSNEVQVDELAQAKGEVENFDTEQKYSENEFQGNTEREQELTHIQQRSHQDSSYSEAGHMFDMLQQQQKIESSQIEQSNILVKDINSNNSEANSKVFNKDELKQQYDLINQEIYQLKMEKQSIIKQKNFIAKGIFQPNYKNFADIADDNEALYKAKELIKRMNQQRQGKINRIQLANKKVEEYFLNLENLRQNQEEMKNRYEVQRKQQIQNRIEEYHKKQKEFSQLQQLNCNFVKKLTHNGPQQGQLSKEVENNASLIKGGYRKLKLQNYGLQLPKIKQNQSSNLQLQKFMNEELVRSRQDEMINKYQASKMALLKSTE